MAILFSTLWVYQPISPCLTLSAHAETISQGHCYAIAKRDESFMTGYAKLGNKKRAKSTMSSATFLS